mmetsp:Transcript_97233/g.279909  ORF Transcript_97233/g.279909 Transcript_97233/m.279909 type:complete len:204 (+) Transcript_97233:889-1500(+)
MAFNIIMMGSYLHQLESSSSSGSAGMACSSKSSGCTAAACAVEGSGCGAGSDGGSSGTFMSGNTFEPFLEPFREPLPPPDRPRREKSFLLGLRSALLVISPWLVHRCDPDLLAWLPLLNFLSSCLVGTCRVASGASSVFASRPSSGGGHTSWTMAGPEGGTGLMTCSLSASLPSRWRSASLGCSTVTAMFRTGAPSFEPSLWN